jgi:hypothetical protein
MNTGQIAGAVGRGLLAGLAGTAAMTLSSTLEAKLSGRSGSTVPAQAVEEAFDVEPRTDEDEQKINTLAHWGYGTTWGAVRGLIGVVGLRGLPACGAHLAAVWGGAQVVQPALGVASPTWDYGGKALTTDVLHHTVYAAATGLVYEWLDRQPH